MNKKKQPSSRKVAFLVQKEMERKVLKIRERGIIIGSIPTGENNCLIDVPGVRVGHKTIDEKTETGYACTGVTAILPHGGNLFKEKVVATSYVINGFGKTTGLVQVNELGQIESPIMLTNTFSVPAVTQGTLQYMLQENKDIGDTTGTINIVTGECNDGLLNSIREMVVTPKDTIEAILHASTNPVEEGAVGAGKGMVCFGYKGGIGTSSRKLSINDGEFFHVGCLVLSNFGGKPEFPFDRYFKNNLHYPLELDKATDGSIMIVLATDAPLSDRQLHRVAKRCGIGLGRTGSHYSHGSGDIVIAFSTANTIKHKQSSYLHTMKTLREDHSIMNELFAAAAEVTEEAIMNSLSQAETTVGRNETVVHSLFDLA